MLLVGFALMATVLPVGAEEENDCNAFPEDEERICPAPRSLSARIVEDGVQLQWLPPFWDAESVEGYEIHRRRPNRGEPEFSVLVSDTNSLETTHLDKTATEPGVRYTYRVKAIRSRERSHWSSYATAMLVPTLVGNLGQPATTATITNQYALGFRLGTHGQGYEISSVWIDLAEAPSDLTVSLWISSRAEHDTGYANLAQRKLFDFATPSSLVAGLNRFTAPAEAFAYQNINYFIVLSGFGTSLSIKETTSDAEDPGGEPRAMLFDAAQVRESESNVRWLPSAEQEDVRENVLRLGIVGSRRDRGVLASSYGQAWKGDLETLSTGDDCCFDVTLGGADRYLIRSLSVMAWGSTGNDANGNALPHGGFFGLPFDLQYRKDNTDITLFRLAYTSAQGGLVTGPLSLVSPAGISEWAAPRGATVAGGSTYTLHMTIEGIEGDACDSQDRCATRGGVVFSQLHGIAEGSADPENYDTPMAPGVTITGHGDIDIGVPQMAIHGEQLHAMVQTVGQADNSHATVGGPSTKVLSQGFTTGPSSLGYRLQGIGVEIEGSESNNDPQMPDGRESVSVAVHADSNGRPGVKLFDLVSPDAFAPGALSFFEAPAGTTLDANTSYALVWSHLSGTYHRLHQTTSDSEDAGALTGFSIADVFYRGASLSSTLSESSNTLQMAVYGEAVEPEPLQYQVKPGWFHMPDGVSVGDRFRVVFTTFGGVNAESAEIEDYNAFVQQQAAAVPNDRVVRALAPDFRAVVCTADVDARTNTAMTDAEGVPIYWLDGGWDDFPTLIAETYDQFFHSPQELLSASVTLAAVSGETDLLAGGTASDPVGTFIYGGKTYTLSSVEFTTSTEKVLAVYFDEPLGRGALANLEFKFKDSSFALVDSPVQGTVQGYRYFWANSGLSVSADDEEEVVLTGRQQWINPKYAAYPTGNTRFFRPWRVWTGCDVYGMPHPKAHLGTTDSGDMATLGSSDLTNLNMTPLGPIDVSTGYDSAELDEHWPILAISPVLTVVPAR